MANYKSFSNDRENQQTCVKERFERRTQFKTVLVVEGEMSEQAF